MDQTVPPVVQPVQKKGWKERIPALTLSGVIALLVFLILFALNYFNILHVYRFIPGFSYLPRYTPKVVIFQHDKKMSEAALDAFLRKNVSAAYLPNTSNKYFSNNVVTEANWVIKKGDSPITFDARLFPERSNNDVRYIRIFVSPVIPVDAKDLHDTLASYFNVTLPSTIPCIDDTQNNSRYCQLLTRTGSTRQIVGAQFGLNGEGKPSPQSDVLYFCELYQNVVDNPTVSCINVR